MSKGSSWGRRFLRAVRSIGWCSGCGSRHNLEFAHIKKTPLSGHSGRGMNSRALDILHHPKCYVFKCWECHLKFDGKNATTVQKSLSKAPPEEDWN